MSKIEACPKCGTETTGDLIAAGTPNPDLGPEDAKYRFTCEKCGHFWSSEGDR